MTVQHAYWHEFRVFRDAVCRASDGAGDMGAVAVAVGRAIAIKHGVIPGEHSIPEVLVIGLDSGVNDVGADTSSIRGVGVGPVEWK